MLDERLQYLLDKQFLTIEEMEEIEEHTQVINTENCGNSGNHIGYIWHTVATIDGEYNIYVM